MSDATLSEENVREQEAAEADATVAIDEAERLAAEYDGPVCEKCGHANDAAACPKCGWYPVLGIHVEIDEAFEAVMNAPTAEATEAETKAEETTKPDWKKHLEVWNGLIPGWAWLMIGTTLGAIGAGIGVRVATLSTPTLQTYCGVGGLLGGVAIAAIAHLVGFLLCSSEDAEFGVPDLIIKPLKTWKKLASQLPERLWLANSGNLGVSVALSSALIVGGVPYERLLDWGYKPRAKKSLVAMIAEQAANTPGNGTDSLEDAVGDFADKGAGKLDNLTPKPAAPAPRKKLECLILGFKADSDGRLRELLLAADEGGKLKYVGKVRPELSRDERIELLMRMEGSVERRPFVKTRESATYVQPRFMCRVTYTDWTRGKKPKDLQWDELMDEVKLPW